ncbi:MAG TPA: hypothetical protein VG898_05850 [Solirubrobacterales bacterium]|nr:hypothetical protein [Solirubrobacterales bacterium]
MSRLAPIAALAIALWAPAAARAEFGFLDGAAGFSALATAEGGSEPAAEAGSHPYSLVVAVNFKPGGGSLTDGDVRDLAIEEPPGLIENPAAVPQCTQALFHTPRSSPFEASRSGESCPDSTQIGVARLRSSAEGGGERSFGVFNLAPPPGRPSALGLNPYGAPLVFYPRIRPAEGEYGLTLEAANITQAFDLQGLELTIWGTPWSVAHNSQRGNCLNETEPAFGWAKCRVTPPESSPTASAYLTLPGSCAGPLAFTVRARSWQRPQDSATATALSPALGDCEKLPFAPSISGQLSDPRASAPSGYLLDLSQDQGGLTDPRRLAPAPPKKAVIALPEGITVNPSVGAGLGVCSPAAYAAEAVSSPPGAGCPNQSKVGDFTVTSPLFAKPIAGSLFLAQPYQNPFGSLIALYLVAAAPERGVLVKVAGEVGADPRSGRLTASFDRLPQLPYSQLEIHFREGQRSMLATPAACGSYATAVELSPWLDPATVLRRSAPFRIAAGHGGGPCPAAPAPFAPRAVAGTLNSNAGSYTPFYLHLTRTDPEQEVTSYSTVLAPGLLGRIAAIPYCPEAAIAAAASRSGFAEAARPSCPAASEIGHTYSGYGLGTVLAYAPGGLYLAGPFHGAPLSIVAIDSATVGPFDLGTIVVRSAIRIEPQTARVSIDSSVSDPIPHILDGIPIHLRDVRVYIDRPGFTLNPTNCDPFSIASTLTGSLAPFTERASSSADPASPFQVAFCSSLGFRPRFSLRLRGGTRRGQHPSLRAVVRPRGGEANIGRAAVTLPPTEFLAQGHIRTVCTRPQFEREACPSNSIYGRAAAVTPLLAEPLRGPVYLRASENPLPDVVAALRGTGGIAIDVVGHVDSSHRGLRGSFEVLPDAPVTKFTMTLAGGRRGVLENAANICATPQLARARFVGQNQKGLLLRPRIAVPCPRKRAPRGKGARR